MGLEKLISGCVQHNTQSQEQLYRLFAGKMYAVCLKYSRNNQEAQDNLHDGFIQIFDKIKQFKNKGSFEGWMKRIMINTALQKFRDKNTLNVIYNESADEEVNINVDEDEISLDFLLKLIQDLPNQYRIVFSLYVLDDYSHKEIAEQLNISEGTSKSNLSRARLILKDKILKAQQNEQFNKGVFIRP